jgi:hypothetical protein
MKRLSLGVKTFTLTILAVCFYLSVAAGAYAQGKQAIVILKPSGSGASVSNCDGTSEINYQLVNDIKLNNKDEVRLVNGLSATGDSTSVSRKAYEDSGKSKLKDLSVLKWSSDGLIQAISVVGQAPILAIPDNMKPQKNADQPLSSFYSVMLTGEARDGKQKRKINLALRDVWKVYFVPEGTAVNDALFRHAAEEKSVALWEAYLQKTSNYRGSEANTYMRDALITCAKTNLDSFVQGDYGSLERARQKTERAQSVKNDETTRQLTASIEQAKQKVDTTRGQVDQLIRASKWDEAITAAEPIKIYLTTWPDLNSMYTDALKRSHELHLFKGEEALRNNQLDVALNDCTVAWRRLPDSVVALNCVCKSRNLVALRDSGKYRQQKRPKDAKELLEVKLADTDCSRDEAVAKELNLAKCEYAQQLLTEARQLIAVGGAGRAQAVAPPGIGRRGRRQTAQAPVRQLAVNVKAISAQSKKDFREARSKLMLGFELCQDEQIRVLLEAANRRLSDYCLEEARKAMQRDDYGTAYVYLQTAQEYTPSDSTVLNMLGEARNQFDERTRVSIGVVLDNNSRDGSFDVVLNEVAAAIESIAPDAGLAKPIVLDRREAANAFRAIQSGKALASPTAIFSGDLISASLNRRDNPQSVRSSYSYENPNWKEADRIHDAVNENLKKCQKQPGVDCSGLQAQVNSLRANRDRYQRNITEYYSYRQNQIVVEGGVRMSLRFTDSVSRSLRTADTLQADVNGQCVERAGVHRLDYSARDNVCNIPDKMTFVEQMTSKIKGEARMKAFEQLRALPFSYYTRARSAANRQQAVEDYLRFLFLTRDKGGSEAQEAQKALLAYDPELKTDGILR